MQQKSVRQWHSPACSRCPFLPAHNRIRPTTDAALLAGLAYTLISENWVDEAQINRYSVGYDASTLPDSAAPHASYRDYVLGNGEDGIAKTPEWAAAITGIPATRIRQLAREMAGALPPSSSDTLVILLGAAALIC